MQAYGCVQVDLSDCPSLKSLVLDCAELLPGMHTASLAALTALTINCSSAVHKGVYEELPSLESLSVGSQTLVRCQPAAAAHHGDCCTTAWASPTMLPSAAGHFSEHRSAVMPQLFAVPHPGCV